jgi:hypothetical protein
MHHAPYFCVIQTSMIADLPVMSRKNGGVPKKGGAEESGRSKSASDGRVVLDPRLKSHSKPSLVRPLISVEAFFSEIDQKG